MLELGTLNHTLDEYEDRLRIEIDTIKRMGFPGYFLIVWDFIAYARNKGIPVGPGRGSAAGSLAAFCLRITDVDPIQYDLLFERFLNPERISMPDIDIDFCIRGRGDVIQSCHRILRQRVGLPDHHVWNDGIAGRDQGCRTSIKYAVWRCRKRSRK